jgi:hypothetical protein
LNHSWEVRQRKYSQFSEDTAANLVVTTLPFLQQMHDRSERNVSVTVEGSSVTHMQHKSFRIVRVAKNWSQTERSGTADCVRTGLTILRCHAAQAEQSAFSHQAARPVRCATRLESQALQQGQLKPRFVPFVMVSRIACLRLSSGVGLLQHYRNWLSVPCGRAAEQALAGKRPDFCTQAIELV